MKTIENNEQEIFFFSKGKRYCINKRDNVNKEITLTIKEAIEGKTVKIPEDISVKNLRLTLVQDIGKNEKPHYYNIVEEV